MGVEVDQLDPESRALLELSVIRGLPDDELAGMLGMEVGRLRARREAVMGELGADSADEREALALSLRTGEREEPEPEIAAEPEAAAEPRRRAGVLALVGGVAIAVVVAIALALGGDDSPDFSGDREPAGPQAPRDGRLAALGGIEGGGTARITGPEDGRVLRLTVQGLPRPPRGGYVIWLYDSLSNARPLTGSRRGTFSVREPLPPGFARYSFLDVSREPADGNRNHSGLSVLRVPLEQVPGA